VYGAEGSIIGTGSQNTLAIEAACPTPNTAADICANLDLEGYSDWFLPSFDEIAAMNNNLHLNGYGNFAGFSPYGIAYSCSTQVDSDDCGGIHFGYDNNGYMAVWYKYQTLHVRAVRAF